MVNRRCKKGDRSLKQEKLLLEARPYAWGLSNKSSFTRWKKYTESYELRGDCWERRLVARGTLYRGGILPGDSQGISREELVVQKRKT